MAQQGSPRPRRAGSFEEFHRAAAHLPGPERLAAFYALPAEQQADVWAQLEARSERDNDYLRRGRVPPATPVRAARRAPAGAASAGDLVETLRAIEPREYVERLTGVEVPSTGYIRCPLPEHEDRTPSFKVYADGWRCFGCGAYGRVFELGAALYGLDTTGSDFLALKARLADELGVVA